MYFTLIHAHIYIFIYCVTHRIYTCIYFFLYTYYAFIRCFPLRFVYLVYLYRLWSAQNANNKQRQTYLLTYTRTRIYWQWSITRRRIGCTLTFFFLHSRRFQRDTRRTLFLLHGRSSRARYSVGETSARNASLSCNEARFWKRNGCTSLRLRGNIEFKKHPLIIRREQWRPAHKWRGTVRTHVDDATRYLSQARFSNRSTDDERVTFFSCRPS